MKALVIDDSPVSRRVLRIILKSQGIETIEASDGMQALKCLQKDNSIELAFIDWRMPKMSGIEFIKEVRRNDAFASLKLLMVTACDLLGDSQRARELGADDFINKPVTRSQVVKMLEQHGLN